MSNFNQQNQRVHNQYNADEIKFTVNVGKAERVYIGGSSRVAEIREVDLSFLQADGTYPKHSWIDKENIIEIMLGQNSRITDEKWEPRNVSYAKLRQVLMNEINKWTLKGWELVESDIEKLFIHEQKSQQTIGTAIGMLLSIPIGLAWKHWIIFYGARFHIRKYLD